MQNLFPLERDVKSLYDLWNFHCRKRAHALQLNELQKAKVAEAVKVD